MRSPDPQRRHITSFKIVKSKDKGDRKGASQYLAPIQHGHTNQECFGPWWYRAPPLPEITISHFTVLIPKSHHHSSHFAPLPLIMHWFQVGTLKKIYWLQINCPQSSSTPLPCAVTSWILSHYLPRALNPTAGRFPSSITGWEPRSFSPGFLLDNLVIYTSSPR